MSKNQLDNIYEFTFKGLLAEESLDRVGRKTKRSSILIDLETSKSLSIDLMDESLAFKARQMSIVYTAIATFENSVRELVSGVLAENIGENWWKKVSKGIRNGAEKRMQDELVTKWHTQRGKDPINYTTLKNLLAMMRNNWNLFEPYIVNIEWANTIFDAIERSRNVIMHSGELDKEDIQRLGIYIKDWIKQVGT